MIELTTKQTQAIDILEGRNGISHILYGGGAGGGKSVIGCYWILKSAFKYPGSRWVIAREVLKRLKETTLLTFFEVCRIMKIPKPAYNYNQQDMTITFVNGSVIFLKELKYYPSDPQFDSLGSLEICGAFVDECATITWKAINVLSSRCRYKLKHFGIEKKILMTCNPAKGWVYKEFYSPSKEGTLPDYYVFIKSLVTDNKYVDPSYIETLQRLPKELRERLLYGNFEYDDDPRVLIPYDNIVSSIYAFKKPGIVTHISADIARFGRDMSVVVLWYGWDAHVYTYKKMGVDKVAEIIQRFMSEYNVPAHKVVVDEDGVGGGVVDILNCKGFINNAKPMASKVDEEGKLVPENYTNLKSQCYFKFAEVINQNFINIFTDETNTLIEEMEQIKQAEIDFDTKKLSIVSKDEVKEKIGRSPDITDALMMRMFFELKPTIKFADACY